MAELNMQNNPLTLSMINAVRNSMHMFHESVVDELGKQSDIEPIDIQMLNCNVKEINNQREVIRLLTAGNLHDVLGNNVLKATLLEALQVAFDIEH